MATYPTRLDPTWTHLRQREPPLFQMPHMWQANLNMTSPYTSSHCDRVQRGWAKWGHDNNGFYARSAAATVPDWYARRVATIRGGDMKELLWSWEGTSKATEKKVFGIDRKVQPVPCQRGHQSTPHDIDGQVAMPRWGLYHPHHYEEPSRALPLPPIHPDEKHL